MEAAGDLFVEKGVLHGEGDVGIHAKGKFPYIAGPSIPVEYLVDPLGVVAGGFHDLALPEGEGDVFIGEAFQHGRGIVPDGPLDAALDRRGINLPIRDVHVSCALDGRNPLDGEAQVRTRADDMDLIRTIHERL